jgi:uncharacterized membrane protein YvlD (DUF360 family)
MILTLFSFGLSWAILAFTFFGLASVLPGFHSAYIQSTFSVGFAIGFIDALIVKSERVMAFEVPAGILYLLILIADFLMIEATSNSQIGYYVMGRKSPLIAATVLAAVAFLVEFIKGKFRADAR